MKKYYHILLVFLFFQFGCANQLIHDFTKNHTLYSSSNDFLGELAHFSIRDMTPGSQAPLSWATVHNVFRKIIKANTKVLHHKNSHFRYRLFIIDSDVINAFSTPNGIVYMTTGFLKHVRSEAALAGVLGHEIAHTELEHSKARIARQQITTLGFGLPWLFAYQFTQDEEIESDKLGLDFAIAAGYSAEGVLEFNQMMQHYNEAYGLNDGGFLTTHPTSKTRNQELKDYIKQKNITPGKVKRASAVFKEMKKEITNLYYPNTYRPQSSTHHMHYTNPKLHQLIASIEVLLEYNLDLEYAYNDLIQAKDLATTKKEEAGVQRWLARIAFSRGLPQDAMKHANIALSLYPEFQDLQWIDYEANVVLGTADRKNAWFELATKPTCNKNLHCTFLAILYGRAYGIDQNDTLKVAKRYHKLALNTFHSGVLPDIYNQELNGALLFEYNNALKLAFTKDEKTTIDRTPKGFKPDQKIKDLKTSIARYWSRKKRKLTTNIVNNRGWAFSVGMGLSKYTGALHSPFGTGFHLDGTAGYWVDRWEIGALLDLGAPRSADIKPGFGKHLYSNFGIGLYGQRKWSYDVIYPWSSLGVQYEAISEGDDDPKTRSNQPSSGLSTSLKLGYAMQLSSQVSTGLALGLKKIWLSNEYFSGDQSLNWKCMLVIHYRSGFAADAPNEDQKPDDTYWPERPPNFY